MLNPIDRRDVPSGPSKGRSPMREFARSTVDEFITSSKTGDVAEVTGWPDVTGDGPRNVQKLASDLRTELYWQRRQNGFEGEVRVMTRGGARVFLERAR